MFKKARIEKFKFKDGNMVEFANCEREKKSAIRPKKFEGEGVAEWLSVSAEPKYEIVNGSYCDTCVKRESCY